MRVKQAEMRKENYLMVAIKYLSSGFLLLSMISYFLDVFVVDGDYYFLGDDLASLKIFDGVDGECDEDFTLQQVHINPDRL